MQKTFNILFLCGILSFSKEMSSMENVFRSYDEEINRQELLLQKFHLQHIYYELNDLKYFLNNEYVQLTNAQKAEAIEKQTTLTQEQARVEKSLAKLCKKETKILIDKLINESKNKTYHHQKNSRNMQLKNTIIKK